MSQEIIAKRIEFEIVHLGTMIDPDAKVRGVARATVTGGLDFTFRLHNVIADRIADIIEAAALAEIQRISAS